MRVLLNGVVARSLASGVEQSIVRLADALARVGKAEYWYVTPFSPPTRPPQTSRFQVVRAPWWTRCRAGRIAWEQTVLPRLAKQARCDLVHASAYVAPCFVRRPIVLTVYDMIALQHPEWCRFENVLHYRIMMPISIRRAEGIIVPSTTTASEIGSRFSSVQSRITVIPLGVGEEFFRDPPPEELDRVRQQWGLPTRFLLWVGRREPKKNLAALLDAYRRLRRSVKGVPPLIIAGAKGWGTAAVEAITHAYGLGNDVREIGFVPVEHLPALYRLADIFVFPSLYEGFGLPPLEAQASGIPVVCSNRGSLPETVGDGARFADPTDPENLAQAIAEVLENRPLRAELIRKGAANARRYSWEETARRTEAVYQTVWHRARGGQRLLLAEDTSP